MNKVILMGRLTRNPEIRYSQNDSSMAIARFTLAVDRRFKRDNEATADFIGCVAFGRQAEFMSKYTRQGTKLCLEGRIQTGSYTKQDGTKVYTTDVVVENVEFAESKAASGGQPGMGGPMQGQPYNAAPQGYGSQSYQQAAPQQGYGGQSYQQAAPQQGYGSQPYQEQAPDIDYHNQAAPMQEAADEGFMQIPDELTDEGLPFN